MSIELAIGKFVKETNDLYEKLCEVYTNHERNDMIVSLNNSYKEVNPEDKICLSFVGQYSAGKSTIIKALTREDNVLIDSDIATSEVKEYSWGNVVLVDTPGLNTNENKKHDELTQEAIKKSDLLVYCITSDLFSLVTKKDFKELAASYRSKLFLVVNKMSKETGEYETLVHNYTETINRTLAPEYALVDFHHCFLDAADFIEGIGENDEDFIEDSHFEAFIDELNKFIKNKGLSGKMVTPVQILIDSIDETLIEIEDDEHSKEQKQLVQRICKIVDEKKMRFTRACNDEVQKISNKFIQKGDEIAIHMTDKGFSFTDSDLQNFSDPLQENTCHAITTYFEKYAEETNEEVQKVLKSELATHFFNEDKKRLEHKLKGHGNNSEMFAKVQQGLGNATNKAVPKVTSFFTKFANLPEGKPASIWSVNGSDLHIMVKKIGGKLGYKFKPFEAVKISKKIANASKFLGPILTGVGTVVELFGILAEKGAEKKQDKAKENTKLIFRSMAEETEEY